MIRHLSSCFPNQVVLSGGFDADQLPHLINESLWYLSKNLLPQLSVHFGKETVNVYETQQDGKNVRR